MKFQEANFFGEKSQNEKSLIIAGVDEVGRGAYAGPVVAAAVILPKDYFLQDLTDSKLLSPSKRIFLAKRIRKEALAWAIGMVGQKMIDRINILEATRLAMAMAVARLCRTPDFLYIDGNAKISMNILERLWRKHHAEKVPPQKTIVQGDKLHPAISAASIIAKTYRDQLMTCLGKKYPEYGFGEHFGYGTPQHTEALSQHGPIFLHRQSFRGVRQEKEKRHVEEGLLF